VNWLGRKGASPSEPVTGSAANKGSTPVNPNRKNEGRSASWALVQDGKGGPPQTIAQALLSTLAAVAAQFGVIVVELDAEDNGSGKLVKYYADLGFKVTCQLKGFDVDMEASCATLSRQAPAEWVRGLVPQDFDAWGWLQPCRSKTSHDGGDDPLRAILLAPDVPWTWTWKVLFPEGARVDAKISLNKSDRVCCDVWLKNHRDEEIAYARGSIRIRQRTLRVLWFGRSKSRPVHPSVQGQLTYRAGDQPLTAPCNCTAATAVLGSLAALGRWFDVTTVPLTACGDTSGQLLCHLKKLGFDELEGAPAVQSVDEPVNLTASCKTLVHNCCPPEWCCELPPDSALGMLHRL